MQVSQDPEITPPTKQRDYLSSVAFLFELIKGVIDAPDLLQTLKINIPQIVTENCKTVCSSCSPQNRIVKLVDQAHCLINFF